MLGRRSRVALAVTLIGLAACSDDDASTPTTAPPPAPTTTIGGRPDDGVLRIGLLLPASGEGVAIGQTMADAARRAILEINAAGGLRGTEVELVAADEGETPSDATRAIELLLDENVDAVVGPASSTIALATLEFLVNADVLTCSPSATSLALDSFPDDQLFFRTAPSDTLQAGAITSLAERTGETTLAITWIDDVYGRPFADLVVDELATAAPTLEVVAQEPFTATADDLTPVTLRIAERKPRVVIVIADAEHGARMLTALGQQLAVSDWDRPEVIVSDAVRRPPSNQAIADLPAALRAVVTGVSPSPGGGTLTGPFATNAYDCVNLIALAAEVAGVDDAQAMAAVIPAVSSGGGSCRTFDQCATLLVENNLNIDYEGPDGGIDIDDDGNRAIAQFSVFRFNSDGVDEQFDTINVTG